MSEDAKQALKAEAEVLDSSIYGLNRTEEVIPKDELDDDDAPLALSKARKKKSSISTKVKKQESEDEEQEKPLKKKEVLKKHPKIKGVELDSEEEEEDEKPPHKKSKKRKRMKEKKTVRKVKKTSISLKKGKNDTKQKKIYELPGQKHDSPDVRDPLRIFYETLYEKVPTSEMAATWLMEWGLLPLEEAQKVHAKKLKKHVQKFGSPAKSTPPKKSSAISVKKVKVTSRTMVKKVRKKTNDSEDEENDDDGFDFIRKKSGGTKKSGRK